MAAKCGCRFRPYDTNGNWVYSEAGWTWVSNYSWGWAPFHYGRWFYDGGYGWMWRPGNEWAPAWVTWGQSGDYYGWAPLPPNTGYNWRLEAQGSGLELRTRRLYEPPWRYKPLRGKDNVTIINNTTIINNIYTSNGDNRGGNGHRGFSYNRGPQVNEVETRTHNTIRPVSIV